MDHVPPRSIFPEKLPQDDNLVTAPACRSCHKANQIDDSAIRNLLISASDVEKHPAITQGLASKRDRSFARSIKSTKGDFQQIFEMMKLVDRKTADGIYLGKDWAINYDNKVMHRFVSRLGRALLNYEFEQTHFEGNFGWRLNLNDLEVVYEGIQKFGRIRKVNDIFAYGVTPLKNDVPAWVIANFYGRTEFLIKIELEGEQKSQYLNLDAMTR